MGIVARLLGKRDANLPSLTTQGGLSDYVELYHRYFRRGSLPDPGAAVYGYDTLLLIPFYPINEYGQVQRNLYSTAPQLYAAPAVLPYQPYAPIGQIISQPLYDPDAVQGT